MNLAHLCREFRYKRDGKLDNWRILSPNDLVGDCDDFAMTAAYIEADSSIKNLWYDLIIGDKRIEYCIVGGEGHAVYRSGARYIDNIQRKWCSKRDLEKKGYIFKWYYGFFCWQVALKMILGKLA